MPTVKDVVLRLLSEIEMEPHTETTYVQSFITDDVSLLSTYTISERHVKSNEELG